MVAVVLIASYLLGSIPTGYLLGRAKGIDIRCHGSGNVGAANIFRTLGKGPGIITLILDLLKGMTAVLWIAPWAAGEGGRMSYLPLLAGISVIIGHNWTIFLKFRGGKGVATSAGVFLGLAPLSLGISFLIFSLVFGLTRYVSLASILAAVFLPLSIWFFQNDAWLFALGLSMAALIIFQHRSNIGRLLRGEERKTWLMGGNR